MQVNRKFGWVVSAVVIGCLSVPTLASPLYGVHFDTGAVYSINETNAAVTPIGSTGVVHLGALEFAPDGFFYSFSTGEAPIPGLYRINPTTFETERVGTMSGEFTFEGSLAVSSNGTMYGIAQNSEQDPLLFTVDLQTAATSVVGEISGGFHDINALAWRDDGMLVGLDRISNALLAINPSNGVSSMIKEIDETVGAVGGMAVMDGVGYFSTSGFGLPSPGSNQLFSFDLFTGEYALIGSFDPEIITGVGISGLAVPEPTSLVLLFAGGTALCGAARRPKHAGR